METHNHNHDGKFAQGNTAGSLRKGAGRPRWARKFAIPACGTWGDKWRGYRIVISGLGFPVVVLSHPKRAQAYELTTLADVRWIVAQFRAAGLRRILKQG